MIADYTFNARVPLQSDVPGYSKSAAGPAVDKGKTTLPISTAEYLPCAWRGLLNKTTFTVGINNVFNLQPPFVAGATKAAFAAENGYDEATFNPKGRFWYVALKKRF